MDPMGNWTVTSHNVWKYGMEYFLESGLSKVDFEGNPDKSPLCFVIRQQVTTCHNIALSKKNVLSPK